jgi:hypothetical protein
MQPVPSSWDEAFFASLSLDGYRIPLRGNTGPGSTWLDSGQLALRTTSASFAGCASVTRAAGAGLNRADLVLMWTTPRSRT